MPKPKICFTTLGAYHLLAEKNTNVVGGSELQHTLIAKELKKRGFDVSFIVFDHGQKSLEVLNGIRVFKACSLEDFTKKRPLKLLLIFRALDQANADIYCVRAGRLFVGLVAIYCLVKNKKLVYSIASDMDTDVSNFKKVELLIFRFAIKRANLVIAQSEYQRKNLKRNFDKDSAVVKNICILSNNKTEKENPPIILWVSTIKGKWKQPELFLKLAKEVPDAKFQMVGGPSKDDPQYFERIKRLADEIPILDFVGFVPHHEMDKYFNRASIFVNTSSVEGFPNTFLQAWANYMPVVSLNVDPDGIICKHKLGFHAKTFEQMIEDVKLLLKDEKLRKKMGENGRRYVELEHDIKKIVEIYIRLFQE